MINPPFVTGSYYHIYNRGVEKRNIFIGMRDYQQFLLAIDFYRKNPLPAKLSDFKRGMEKIKKIENQIELVQIFSYCLMPNHFHFLLKQTADGGITRFLRKFANSYTRYFNTKHDRIGPLFQGTFKAKLIETDAYLLQVSKYIHRNPLKLNSSLHSYPYSSYKYYLSQEKHPFCNTEFILSYFSTNNPNLSYQSFVEETEIEEPADIYPLFIDPDEEE